MNGSIKRSLADLQSREPLSKLRTRLEDAENAGLKLAANALRRELNRRLRDDT